MTDMSNSMQFLLVGSLQPDVLSGSEPEINRLLEEERAHARKGLPGSIHEMWLWSRPRLLKPLPSTMPKNLH